MTVRIQIIIAAIIITGIVVILNFIKRNTLELKYALSWIFVGVSVLVLDCTPSLMKKIAHGMGIGSPVNMIFFFGFCFTMIIMFTLTVALSITASSVKRLTQKTAMLEKRIVDMEKEEKAEKRVSFENYDNYDNQKRIV